ncbi:hypothetical protein TNCT_590201 [Trichonephila clavata]|uniref:Uncharacterized protein n=1 Tax=Trichonephila clavata TaxID=2740835 RepID=A0A8X6LX67_TRICU|nr:hypothetical protein TNCT_590201 [Trichonephila clavata]
MLIHFPKTSSRSIKALQDPQQTLRIANPILLHEEWGQGDWILSLESQHSCRSLPHPPKTWRKERNSFAQT